MTAPSPADLDRQFRIGMLVTPRETIVPELWRIVDLEKRIASLKPISLGATQRQAPVTDLRRYRIKTTDQVFREEQLVRIIKLTNPLENELFTYEVEDESGQVLTVREHELTVHAGSEAPDPRTMLCNLDASPGQLAGARADLLRAYFDATAKSLGITGYNGARMLPIPHQISAARHALLFGRPRFLLADEVGLGKTVEAGLIVSTLRKYFPEWQAALFVPESLAVQWAFEMYAKFGKAIFRLDEDSDGWDDEDDDDPGVILPHAQGLKWARKSRKPEILVVDEAHQVLRDEVLFESFVKLSRHAHAVLLLTATPTSDDGKNLGKMLRMVDPERFEKLASGPMLPVLLEKRPQVEELIAALRDPARSFDEIRTAWDTLGTEDEDFAARLMALRVSEGDMAMRHKLAALATDMYNPSARILRYQRKFLAMDNEMAERVEEPVTYKPSRGEKKVQGLVRRWLDILRETHGEEDALWQDVAAVLSQAAHSSPVAVDSWLAARMGEMAPRRGVTGDPVRRRREMLETLERLPGEDELLEELLTANNAWMREVKSLDIKNRALARLPRYEALFQQIKEVLGHDDLGPQRVIVFTSFESNVKPLYLLLNKALGEDVEVFAISADMEWREREKSAFAFQECTSPAVLISDELGGEGRNFQFANTLFHFDLPYFSWMMEQRIGRLDRVGRDPDLDVDSQIILAEGGTDEALYEFQRDGAGVYNESLAPVEGVIETFTRRMIAAMIAGGPDAIREIIPETETEIAERREREAASLLNRRDTGVSEVAKLVPLLDDNAEMKQLERAVINYTRQLGSVVDNNHGKVTVTVGSHHPLHAFTGVLAEMQGFFNRREGVRHERLEFFSPGHPFVRSMARLALMESTDRVAFIQRPGVIEPLCVYSCRISIPPAFLESIRELPPEIQPALFCSAAGNFPTRMLSFAVKFDGTPIPIEEAEAQGWLDGWRRGDRSLDEGTELTAVLPQDWEEICARTSDVALNAAKAEAEEMYHTGIGRFTAILSEALTRHHGPDFAVEAQIDTMLFGLEPLAVEIDSARALLPQK